MNRRSILTLSAALLCTGVVHAAAQNAPKLTTEEFMVPTQQVGIQLYVRNKHPDDMNVFTPERTVLFVHGATYPVGNFVRSTGRRSIVDGPDRASWV
jgi:hypothetical protein